LRFWFWKRRCVLDFYVVTLFVFDQFFELLYVLFSYRGYSSPLLIHVLPRNGVHFFPKRLGTFFNAPPAGGPQNFPPGRALEHLPFAPPCFFNISFGTPLKFPFGVNPLFNLSIGFYLTFASKGGLSYPVPEKHFLNSFSTPFPPFTQHPPINGSFFHLLLLVFLDVGIPLNHSFLPVSFPHKQVCCYVPFICRPAEIFLTNIPDSSFSFSSLFLCF